MTGWNKNYNWTYDQFKKVVNDSLINEKKDSVTLDTEHSDYENEQQIVKWARELGYEAVIIDSGERIRVFKPEKK